MYLLNLMKQLLYIVGVVFDYFLWKYHDNRKTKYKLEGKDNYREIRDCGLYDTNFLLCFQMVFHNFGIVSCIDHEANHPSCIF